MTFMQGCKDFFGMKEGQTPIQFLHEVQKFTEQDREEIKAGLKKHGYNIVAQGQQGWATVDVAEWSGRCDAFVLMHGALGGF